MRVLALFVLMVAASALHAQERRPNILLIYTDDQPANCLGVMGNKEIRTPNLDRLAQRGVVFNNAFVTTAICCCNRACLLTGQHMMRHGIRDFIAPLSAEAMDRTYPAVLRKSGYRTAFLGKFAIGNPTKSSRELSLPKDSFDLWYGFDQSIDFKQEVNGQTRYLTEVMTEKAIDFLEKHDRKQPFCMTIALKEPHGPHNYFDPKTADLYENADLSRSPTCTEKDFAALPEFIRKSLNADGSQNRISSGAGSLKEKRTAYRLITRADQAVGEVIAALAKYRLDDNTVVIFTSDHGSLLGDHGLSGKWLMYENSIRVPMIVFDPRLETKVAGTRREEMVLSIDLATTMLAMAGLKAPEGMQGMNMMPLIQGEKISWRDHYYYEHTYQTSPPRSPIPTTEGIRTQQWKYIRYPDTTPVFEQLFDLAKDPLEQHNLASQSEHQTQLTKLRKQCDSEREAVR